LGFNVDFLKLYAQFYTYNTPRVLKTFSIFVLLPNR